MTAALAAATPSPMIVRSDLLGPLEVAPEDVSHFPAGLYGFPECRSFVLVPAVREGLFWLQATDHSTLAFLLVDPFVFFEGYAVDLGPADRLELGVADAAEVAILAIVTLPGGPSEAPTANLQGPLAFNLAAGRGKQLALPESEYGVRCPLDLAAHA